MKRAAWLVRIGLLIWLSTFLALLAVSAFWPKNAPLPARADAIVCLGGSMSYMGWERPGPASARRARTCAELQRAGVAPVIVFTGYGHHVLSAAEAMARLAERDGAPRDAMIIEPRAQSTIQNAAFSLPLLPDGATRIVVVTDAFHMPRSWMIFRAFSDLDIALYAARMEYTTEDKPQTRNVLEWTLRESVVIWVNLGRAAFYAAGRALGVPPDRLIGWFD